MSKDMRRRDRFDASKKRFNTHAPRTKKDCREPRQAPSENKEFRLDKSTLRNHASVMLEYFSENKCYDSVKHYTEYPDVVFEKEETDVIFKTTNVVDYILSLPEDPELSVLNFASAKHAGGGFLKGSMAQEEALCYSTGLYQSLKECEGALNSYILNEKNPRDGLYHPFIIVSEGTKVYYNSSLEEQPERKVSIYSSPAVNFGYYRTRMLKKMSLFEIELTAEKEMKQRIDNLFKLVIANKHRKLIMGPWGCGVFKGNLDKLMYLVKSSEYFHGMKEIHFISTSDSEVERMKKSF
jgi:uncharacterized protein (TIGR02452 family)